MDQTEQNQLGSLSNVNFTSKYMGGSYNKKHAHAMLRLNAIHRKKTLIGSNPWNNMTLYIGVLGLIIYKHKVYIHDIFHNYYIVYIHIIVYLDFL